LDSSELRDLAEISEAVQDSENFIILLTNGALARPWVLVELAIAVREGKNIVAVRVEWPHKDDEKHFAFPEGIDDVLVHLEAYRDNKHKHKHMRFRSKAKTTDTVGSRRSSADTIGSRRSSADPTEAFADLVPRMGDRSNWDSESEIGLRMEGRMFSHSSACSSLDSRD
jgi:hypothetical protein